MSERFIYLMERYFEKILTPLEEEEFNSLLSNDRLLQEEFNEQKHIKEVLSKMAMKNPGTEAWDTYWLNIFNRVERGIAWIFLSAGAFVVLFYASIELISSLLNETQTPLMLRIGIAAFLFGGLLLIFSVIRERILNQKTDKYKEIQR